MIIYQANKSDFLHHALHDDIELVMSRHFLNATGHGVGQAEFRSWKNSLVEMAKVLLDDEIPSDAGIAIEYQLPLQNKRIDFVITGEDAEAKPKVVIVELKQWSESRRSEKDAIVWARRGGKAGETEGPHPSYQAWSYAAYLEDFNKAVHESDIKLQPCAYLHNHPRDGEIDHPHYRQHIEKAPLFLAREREKLQRFIREHVRHGDRKGTLYTIENGRIQPSRMLADSVVALLQGRNEFILLDDQKVAYETILQVDTEPNQRKQVVIVQGGPGTGKSVIAINLLGTLMNRQRNVRYVSKNAAPRAVYEARLTGTFSKTRISNLFSGSGAFLNTAPDTYDVLIVDEAHRLNEKSGLYGNLGDNQIKETIRSSRCTVFFVDDHQCVTLKDIGKAEELRTRAKEFGADITELVLTSQFRCNGSEGYLEWLDDTLNIRKTAKSTLDSSEFDFRVFDSPSEMHELVALKNRANNRSRVVAGYCWKWPSKKNPAAWDIQLPEFDYQRRWNLDKDGSLWIVTPGSVEQVGCIHTCQGLELDYVGVIIGPDLSYQDGRIVCDTSMRASSDKSIHGIKTLFKTDPEQARIFADAIVKNTYRTLMSRGMKGCYVYCTDPALREFLRARLSSLTKANEGDVTSCPAEATNIIPLRRVSKAERDAGVPAAPWIDLRFAAGSFSDLQALEEGADSWVALPDWVSSQPGLFVAQVVGESMNRRIPNGAWCLFRANPAGTRDGKVVVVQHRNIADPETGGRYTVKIYSSEKVAATDAEWRHSRITLRPDSTHPGFQPFVIDRPEEDENFAVVAEFLMVLATPPN